MKIAAILFLVAGSLTAGDAYAHSGGLDGNGCHAGSQPYHCHRSSSRPVFQPVATPPQATFGGDLDCAHFGSRGEAQLFFEKEGPGDPHDLDRDRDGLACEALR